MNIIFTRGVKTLLILNGSLFLFKIIFNYWGLNLDSILSLFYFESEYFKPFQIVTHMFMHADFGHLFFNMFSLFMFGIAIENSWGTKRFIFYYLFTGLGAALLHTAVNWYDVHSFLSQASAFIDNPTPQGLYVLAENNQNIFNMPAVSEVVAQWQEQPNADYTPLVENVESIISRYTNRPMMGASGAVFGLLLAFGMMYPNNKIYLMFIPIGIPAKYFVALYGLAELVFGVTGLQEGVAHFAHLGGMVFGFFLIKYWMKHPHNEFFNY